MADIIERLDACASECTERSSYLVFADAIDEIKGLRSCCQRYETARRMNPQQWAEAWQLNITTGKPLDEIIDDVRRSQLPKTGE